jgi:hypothetical protein
MVWQIIFNRGYKRCKYWCERRAFAVWCFSTFISSRICSIEVYIPKFSEPAPDPVGFCVNPSVIDPIHLKWKIDSSISESIRAAQAYADKTIADSDVYLYHFKGYGSDFIKKNGKCYLISAKVSPDAYVQICLQIAFFRIAGYFAAVYETASTRKYLHGRTETCRSFTVEVKQFITAFENSSTTVYQILNLVFRKSQTFTSRCKFAFWIYQERIWWSRSWQAYFRTQNVSRKWRATCSIFSQSSR